MAQISFKNVSKIYDGEVKAVSNFCLDIRDNTFVVLVGPSGSGKTTVLRMLAGLEEITSGQIVVDGKIVNKVPARKRDIAMVFQRYALFPHYSVYKNIAMGIDSQSCLQNQLSECRTTQNVQSSLKGKEQKNPLKRLRFRKVIGEEEDRRIREAAEFLGIKDLLCRKPNTLSGGQRQRVALARAIVKKPNIFLLDEPLSNLDAKLRTEMRAEILRLKSSLETTFLYVTHDQTEAMTMADCIVVMDGGFIRQIGTPKEIYNHPESRFVAEFIGNPQMNFFDCTLLEEKSGVKGNNQLIDLLISRERIQIKRGLVSFLDKEYIGGKKAFSIGIRPDDIYLEPKVGANFLELCAKIRFIEETGGESLIHCDLDFEHCDKKSECSAGKMADSTDCFKRTNEKKEAAQTAVRHENDMDGQNSLIIKIKAGHSLASGERKRIYLDADKLHFFDCVTGKNLKT